MENIDYRLIVILSIVLAGVLISGFHKKNTISLNLKKLMKYCMSSMVILKKSKWILFFPIFSTIFNYLIKVFVAFYKQTNIQNNPLFNELTGNTKVIEIPPLNINHFFITLKDSLFRIADPYPGIINGIFYFFTIIIITFFYKIISNKLHELSENELYKDGINLFTKILKITFFGVLPILILFIYSITNSISISRNFYIAFIFVSIFAGLAVLTIIQSIIYFIVINYHNNTEYIFTNLVINSFKNFRNLFSYNIYFLLFWSIPALISTIASFASIVNISIYQNILFSISKYIEGPVKLLAFSLIFISIIIIDKQLKFSRAVFINFNIIKKNFPDFILLFIFGILFLFTPYFFLNVISHYHQLLGNYVIILNIIVKILEVTFSGLFYLIIIGYLINNKYYKSLT